MAKSALPSGFMCVTEYKNNQLHSLKKALVKCHYSLLGRGLLKLLSVIIIAVINHDAYALLLQLLIICIALLLQLLIMIHMHYYCSY